MISKLLQKRGKLFTQWGPFTRYPKRIKFEQYICVVKGKEEFRLVSPIFRPNIYVGSYHQLPDDASPVNLFSSDDQDKFPLKKAARMITATVEAGDCLYVPAFFYK